MASSSDIVHAPNGGVLISPPRSHRRLQGAAPHSNPHDYVLLRKTVKNRAVETVLSCLDKLSPSASRKPPEGTKPQRRRSPTLGMISKCVDEAASDGQRDSYDPPGVALPRDAASRVGSWPLVLAAFSFALENHPSSMLHDIGADTAWRVAADLMLWLLQRQTMLASSAPSVSHLQKVHAMAKHLAEKSLQLSSAGHDVGPLAAAVHSAHRSLCNAVALHAKRTDEVYALPEIQDMRDLDTAHIAICEKSLPGPPKYRRHGSRKDGEIKDRLRINMGVTAGLMNPSISELMTDSLTAADVISGKGPSRLIRMQRYVLTFEQAMFNAADSGQWGGFGSEDKLETLKCKVETYRSVASTLRKELHATGAHEAAGMSTVVEMESREILVVWILACLTFEACKEAYPVLRGYHMALDAASLSWLSLSDRCANQAAVAVARYLECAIKEGQKGPLFHLERQESTLSFAAELVAALPSLKSVFDSFRDVELQAQREAWETICEKKRGLDVLRPRLQNMKSELKRVRDISELERSLAAHRKGIEKMEGKMTAEQLEADRKTAEEMQKEINRLRAGSRDHTDGWEARLRSKIRRIEWEIAERKRLPACYGQALPTDDTLARQVVFFHFMPRPLELLFWATVATQQLLMPRWELMSAELVAEFTKHVEEARPWVDVLTSHAQRVPGTACLGTVRDFAVVGVSSYDTAGELWVSSTVDNVDTFERSVELLELRPHGQVQLLWRGAHGGVYPLDRSEGKLAKGLDFFNPLHDSEAARQARIERFTVPVPGMDWAAQLARRSDLTSDPTRGNEGVTRVSSAPTWAPKSLESFAALGTLRAYPHIQLRALSAALSQDRLELGLSQVRLLVLQTLYELGELETGPERVRRTWWRELAVSGGIEHLCEIIRELQGRISLRNWKDCIVPVEVRGRRRSYGSLTHRTPLQPSFLSWPTRCLKRAVSMTPPLSAVLADRCVSERSEQRVRGWIPMRRRR